MTIQTVATQNNDEILMNNTHNQSIPEFKGEISEIKPNPEKLKLKIQSNATTQTIKKDPSNRRVSLLLPIPMKNDTSDTQSVISLNKFLIHQMND